MKIAKFAKNLIVVTVPALIALFLVLEAFFRTVIPASNPPQGFFDEEHGIYKHSSEIETGLFTIGPFARQRGKWRINNAGWNSPIDYQGTPGTNKRRVAVIGDSYIQAFQVDVSESYPALLNESLQDDYEVYSFGVSGAPLSQYLQMSRYVAHVFDPDILIFNIIFNDFYESIYRGRSSRWLTLQVSNDRIQEVGPQANLSFVQYNTIKRLLRKSALVLYLARNLELQRIFMSISSGGSKYAENIDVSVVKNRRNEIQLAARYVVERIKSENPDRRIIFVMDGPKQYIYGESAENEEIYFLNGILEQYCKELGVEFLDLWPLMEEDYAANGTKFNSELDGHWNEYGHEFVHEQVARLFSRDDKDRSGVRD